MWSTAGFIGLAITSEFLYQGYLMLCRYYENALDKSEVNDVLFATGHLQNGDILDKQISIIQGIIDYIDSAQKSIYLAMYMCKLKKIQLNEIRD